MCCWSWGEWRFIGEGTAADLEILNAALATYQLGADSGLLVPAVRTLALTFQGHHRAHAELLGATVGKLGGSAAGPKPKYDFPVASLKAQDDVLRFAAGLEQGAVSAYLAAVPKLADRELARAAASILGDEAMHWAVLRQALGEPPVPPSSAVQRRLSGGVRHRHQQHQLAGALD